MKNLIYVGTKLPSPGEWYLAKGGEYGMYFVKAVIQFKDTQYPVFVEVDNDTEMSWPKASWTINPSKPPQVSPLMGNEISWCQQKFFWELMKNEEAKPAPLFDEWNW